MNCVVVGGGLAGLAAAVHATAKGHRVTLLEARSFCGGRAFAFREPKTGDIIDNGQHLLQGCYRATLAYLEQIGSRHRLAVHPRLAVTFATADGRRTNLSCPDWPAPWHLLAGLGRWRDFPKRDLVRAMWGLRTMRTLDHAGYARLDQWSVTQWLDTMGQSKTARRLLWTPLTLAIMNEEPSRASAAALAMILKEGALSGTAPTGLATPQCDLSSLLVDPAVAWLQQRGCHVRTGTPAEQLLLHDGAIAGIRCRHDETVHGDAFILALAPRELARLLAASDIAGAPWDSLSRWESVPIISVHCWYDQPALPGPMVGLIDAPFDWAFEKNEGRPSATPRGELGRGTKDEGRKTIVSLVKSAAREMAAWPREQIVQSARDTLTRYFPGTAAAPWHVQVTKELHATVSLAHHTAALRLPAHTPWPNVWLAGDWTATGLPATIESAVRSGVHAAAHL